MSISGYQNAGQNRNIQEDNRKFDHVAQLKYLWMNIRHQNYIHKEIKNRKYCNKWSRDFTCCLVW
jgi:hypothetical protein